MSGGRSKANAVETQGTVAWIERLPRSRKASVVSSRKLSPLRKARINPEPTPNAAHSENPNKKGANPLKISGISYFFNSI